MFGVLKIARMICSDDSLLRSYSALRRSPRMTAHITTATQNPTVPRSHWASVTVVKRGVPPAWAATATCASFRIANCSASRLASRMSLPNTDTQPPRKAPPKATSQALCVLVRNVVGRFAMGCSGGCRFERHHVRSFLTHAHSPTFLTHAHSPMCCF